MRYRGNGSKRIGRLGFFTEAQPESDAATVIFPDYGVPGVLREFPRLFLAEIGSRGKS